MEQAARDFISGAFGDNRHTVAQLKHEHLRVIWGTNEHYVQYVVSRMPSGRHGFLGISRYNDQNVAFMVFDNRMERLYEVFDDVFHENTLFECFRDCDGSIAVVDVAMYCGNTLDDCAYSYRMALVSKFSNENPNMNMKSNKLYTSPTKASNDNFGYNLLFKPLTKSPSSTDVFVWKFSLERIQPIFHITYTGHADTYNMQAGDIIVMRDFERRILDGYYLCKWNFESNEWDICRDDVEQHQTPNILLTDLVPPPRFTLKRT